MHDGRELSAICDRPSGTEDVVRVYAEAATQVRQLMHVTAT